MSAVMQVVIGGCGRLAGDIDRLVGVRHRVVEARVFIHARVHHNIPCRHLPK